MPRVSARPFLGTDKLPCPGRCLAWSRIAAFTLPHVLHACTGPLPPPTLTVRGALRTCFHSTPACPFSPRSPASAANGTTTNRNNNHNPTHQQQHPNRHSRRADADPAGLSLSQLGLPETAVLRDSVQLTLESSAGGDGQMAAQVATFGAMAMMKGAAGQQGPAAAGGGGFVGGLAPLDYRRVKEDLRVRRA